MNDERFQRTVGSWLRDEDAAPPDSLHSARQVAARVLKVRQQSRWWPLPLLRRIPAPPAVIPDTDLRPDPTQATNGHSATVIGRTQSMFSPVKAVTAGALVFALGGMFLIAQPFEQQGSVPGAETDRVPEAPTEFSGKLLLGPPLEERFHENADGVVEGRSAVFQPMVLTMSDLRLDGEVTITTESRIFGGEDGITVFNKAFRIENDAGAWQEVPGFVMESSPGWTSTFVGEGDYAGLFAIADVLYDADGWDLHGFILDGDVPPDLAPASIE